jgi:hypothetical protein
MLCRTLMKIGPIDSTLLSLPQPWSLLTIQIADRALKFRESRKVIQGDVE